MQWLPIGSYCTVLSHRCNSRTDGRGEGREPCVLQNTNLPRLTASWHAAILTRKPTAPMCRKEHRTTGDHVIMQAPGLPQELLEHDGTRTSRPNPPLTRTRLGQVCVTSWVSRSWPAATQPGIESRSVVMPQAQRCLRPLRHSGRLRQCF
jgi:hypothetical protein